MLDEQGIETAIADAVRCKILLDKRASMPKGPGKWKRRQPRDILGQCLHQNGSSNTDPIETALYHCGPNHILSHGMPGIAYDFAIPDDGPAWLVADLLDVKYAQGNRSLPGAENLHLHAFLIMGRFAAPSYKGASGPSKGQMRALDKVINWHQDVFNIGPQGLFGHDDFGKSACPGAYLRHYINDKREGCPDLQSTRDWQQALLQDNPDCLPKYGADGDWGRESKQAIAAFQIKHHLPVTGMQDPFTELKLLQIVWAY